MRFSARTGNFAQSAKAVTRDFERSLDAARTYSPKSDEMAIAAANIKSKEKIAATKIKGEITSRGIRAAAAVKSDALNEEGKATLRKSKRKAGVLAAGGKLVADGSDKLFQDAREKRTVGEGSEILTAAEQKARAQAERWKNKANNMTLDDVPGASSTSGTSSTDTDTADTGTSPPQGGVVSSAQAVDAGKGTSGKGGKFSQSDMTKFAQQAGFSPEQARIMGAIGMGESRGNAGIDTVQSGLDPGKSKEYSIGLWQINTQAHGDKLAKLGYTEDDLRDPVKNAKVAKMVYDEVGSFNPWSVYKKGIYQDFL